MSTRRARAASTVRSWSMSRPVDRWTCCPTERHPAWPSGWRGGQGSKRSTKTKLRSSRQAPHPEHPKQPRSLTAGTCCTTSAGRPSGPSPATASVFSSSSPNRPGKITTRPRLPKRHRSRRGGATGSPTASEPGTRPATQCWKLATAAAGSAADSTWPIAPSRDSPTPFSPMSSSGGSGRTTGPPPWTSTSPT